MPSRTILQIQEWKKRLIDLSHRNRLIYFNPSNKTILEFIYINKLVTSQF